MFFEENKIQHKKVKNLLLILKEFVETKSTLPVLSYVYFNDNTVRATTLDYDIAINIPHNLSDICFEFDSFKQIEDMNVNCLKDIKSLDESYVYENDSYTVHFNTLAGAEYPSNVKDSKVLWQQNFTRKQLQELLPLTKIANDLSREMTSSLLFNDTHGQLEISATDNFIVIIKTLVGNEAIEFSLPSYAINKILKVMNFFDETIVNFGVTNDFVFVKSADFTMRFENTKVKTPSYNRYFNEITNSKGKVISPSQIITTLNSIIKTNKLKRDDIHKKEVMFLIDKNSRLYVDNNMYKLPILVDNNFDICMNIVLLNLLLNCFDDYQIDIEYKNVESPLIFKQDNIKGLIMPVETKWYPDV